MKLILQILGTDNGDSNPCLLAQYNDRKYVFNCGEGFQRFCFEHTIRLKGKLEAVFVDKIDWKSVGGLTGLLLTLSDAGSDSIKFSDESTSYDDGSLKVVPIRIIRNSSSSIKLPKLSKQQLSCGPARKEMGGSVVSYMCHPSSPPGKFFPKKALALGVPRGPMFGQLVKGKTITLPCGRVVKPEDCVAEKVSSPIFGMISCPSKVWIPFLVNHSGFDPYFIDSRNCLVHSAPFSVVSDIRYKRWMLRFGTKVQHIFINSETSSQRFTFDASSIAQDILHEVNPTVFPILFHKKNPNHQIRNSKWNVKVKPAQQLLVYNLLPVKSVGFDYSYIEARANKIQNRKKRYRTNVFTNNKVMKTILTNLNNEIHVSISFLGTGSAIPTKLRNVTTGAVPASSSGFLMDCGEGTYGQLLRLVGPTKIEKTLAEIQCIYISHMHADHNLGIVRILSERPEGQDEITGVEIEPVLVIGPSNLHRWLLEYQEINSSIVGKWTFVRNRDIMTPNNCAGAELARRCGINIFNIRVFHPADAYGLIVTASGGVPRTLGWKIVYSGDTRPCDALIRAGQGATLLIHEATLEDGMEVEARAKMHSTVSEALGVSRRMNAFRTILTHFSARYPNVPPPTSNSNTISTDFMRVSFENLLWLPKLLPVMRSLYQSMNGLDDDDAKEEEELVLDAALGRTRGSTSNREDLKRKNIDRGIPIISTDCLSNKKNTNDFKRKKL
eukprot:GSMAST32.ASY1.ANO1.783.1 assembled CDS